VLAYASGHDEHTRHTVAALAAPVVSGAPLQEFLNWCLMVVAMMVPLMLSPMRWLAFQSFRQRRHRAISLFLAGFLVPWMAVGVGVAWLLTSDWGRNFYLAPAVFVVAALWVLLPVRTRALAYCHLTMPLAPSGWKADRDCLRFGATIGGSCVGTCGLLMLACGLTGHNLIAMLGGTVLGALEFRSFRPPVGRIYIGALMLAGWFLLPLT
jgi:Predicted metal-binding integral membrane protein (DUF2182)